jgi:starvation-inducible DNA-binding protein
MSTTIQKMLFPTRIDLPDDTRASTIHFLNARLADALDLERQAKQAHWNVRGARFMPLHLLFDETAALAVTWADDIAERIAQLGGVAEGTVQAIAERTSLSPAPLVAEDSTAWVTVVSDALAGFANAAREAIEEADDADDAITTDLLTRVVGAADKQLWFVESHLQGN